jgi:dTDP-4-dehydrorhamnose 3,5-epimerase
MTRPVPEITIAGVEVVPLRYYNDARGWLVEIYRNDEIGVLPVMSYVSLTHPKVARGPPEHRDQADVFVFMGPSDFRIYLWESSARPRRGLRGGSGGARRRSGGRRARLKYIGTSRASSSNCPDRLYAGGDGAIPSTRSVGRHPAGASLDEAASVRAA